MLGLMLPAWSIAKHGRHMSLGKFSMGHILAFLQNLNQHLALNTHLGTLLQKLLVSHSLMKTFCTAALPVTMASNL